MLETKIIYKLFRVTLFAAVFWGLPGQTCLFAMGMDFFNSSAAVVECTPEENPVIMPGVFGSPLRLQTSSNEGFLIADYKKRAVYSAAYGDSANPAIFFEVSGKPLSLVTVPSGRRTVYLVGNDATKTIDVYIERKNRVNLRKRWFRKTPVQAQDMAIDETSGKIFIVDGLASHIKVIKTDGRLVTTFGNFGQLVNPKAIALDSVNQEIVVSDYGDSGLGISASIQVFDFDGRHLRTITGAFSRPQGVAVAGNMIYVADAVLGQILSFDRSSGSPGESYGCFGSSAGHLLLPMDILIGPAKNNLYVADNRNGRITVLPLAP
ncbi:MAG: NHL repeat-containing protein [Desulfuromonadales bacterium]|nr:NHL repeat-containing protein [Desulfuromonadales bacterium]